MGKYISTTYLKILLIDQRFKEIVQSYCKLILIVLFLLLRDPLPDPYMASLKQ